MADQATSRPKAKTKLASRRSKPTCPTKYTKWQHGPAEVETASFIATLCGTGIIGRAGYTTGRFAILEREQGWYYLQQKA